MAVATNSLFGQSARKRQSNVPQDQLLGAQLIAHENLAADLRVGPLRRRQSADAHPGAPWDPASGRPLEEASDAAPPRMPRATIFDESELIERYLAAERPRQHRAEREREEHAAAQRRCALVRNQHLGAGSLLKVRRRTDAPAAPAPAAAATGAWPAWPDAALEELGAVRQVEREPVRE